MVLIKTTTGWSKANRLPGDPIFYHVRKNQISSRRHERQQKVWPTFPPICPHVSGRFSYRLALMSDLDAIVLFVDVLLSGRDFFCPRGQHIGYFKYKTILLCFDSDKLIGWSVRQKNGALIHLLVDPDYRGQGIGSHLLKTLQPLLIRSKSDQSTGDPRPFYEKQGYTESPDERVGKHKNIDLLSRPPSV